MRTPAYAAFTRTAFRTRLAYRGQVWLSAFGDLVWVFARIAIWTSAYAGATIVDGVTLPEMITYSVIAGPILNWDFARLLNEVGNGVKTGDVSVYLLKPLHYPAYLLAHHFGHLLFELVTIIVPICLIVGFTFGLLPPASLAHGGLFLAFWGLSFLMLFCLATLCGLLAFWLMTVFALEWFLIGVMSLLSGTIVPLWFFPAPLAAIAGYLPFAWVAYYPPAVYLGKLDVSQAILHLVIGTLWLAVLAVSVGLLWSKARNRLVVQGG